jgi:hypothetical protein
MSRKSVIIAAVFGALIVLIAVGVGTMGTRGGFGGLGGPDAADEPAGGVVGPEIALPDVAPDGEYVFLKLAHPEELGSALSSLGGVITRITEDGGLSALISKNLDLTEAPTVIDALDEMADFLDDTEQIALLLTSPDMTAYVSLFADDESFDKFISPPAGSLRKVDEWRGDGWQISLGGSPLFYMTKKPYGDSNLVMVSISEDGTDAMTAASGRSSFVPPDDRRTSGADYFQARVSPEPLEGMEWMSERGPLFFELSWLNDGNKTDFHSFADIYGRLESNIRSSDIKGGFPILGDGDLVMFLTVDMPYACFALFPDRDDPVQAFLDTANEFSPDGVGVPTIFAEDLKALLSNSRLSFAMIMGDQKVNQAYAVVESGISGPIDRLFTMAQLLINRPAVIEGWDSAYSIDVPEIKSSFVLARKGDSLMIGLGTPAAYEQRANIPEGVDVSGGGYFSNVFVTSRIIDAYRAFQDEIASGMGGMEVESLLDILSGVDAIQIRQGAPGVGEMSIYWAEEEVEE